MKKTLHEQGKAFLFEKNGKLYPEEVNIEEIVAGINRGLRGDWGVNTPVAIILREVYNWICRYFEEGATEKLLNELNTELHHVHYFNYVVPPDIYSTGGEEPRSIYVANHNFDYTPRTIAAKEFSKLITAGMLGRIKRCQLSGCENIFIGPPQAKWCSKTCGSKFRVREKRKRDLS